MFCQYAYINSEKETAVLIWKFYCIYLCVVYFFSDNDNLIRFIAIYLSRIFSKPSYIYIYSFVTLSRSTFIRKNKVFWKNLLYEHFTTNYFGNYISIILRSIFRIHLTARKCHSYCPSNFFFFFYLVRISLRSIFRQSFKTRLYKVRPLISKTDLTVRKTQIIRTR